MKNYVVVQLTSRRKFDVAYSLEKRKCLDTLITDLYLSRKYSVLESLLPKKLSGMVGRQRADIPNAKVHSDLLGAALFRAAIRNSTLHQRHRAQIRAYKRLCRRAVRVLEDRHVRQKGALSNLAIYGFDTASLELFRRASEFGVPAVLEQCVAPRNSQIQMYRRLNERYGCFEIGAEAFDSLNELHLREQEEWNIASNIICPSTYVWDELVKAGADSSRLRLLPYGYTPKFTKQKTTEVVVERVKKNRRTFTVLFAGNDAYRKGLPDLVETARILSHENIEFRVAGDVGNAWGELGAEKVSNLNYLGRLSPSDLEREYRKADLFFLPTYLEGSALVAYEALAWGLPLVTTREAGAPIEKDIGGFICGTGNVNQYAEKIHLLSKDRHLYESMALHALDSSWSNLQESYENRLMLILENV